MVTKPKIDWLMNILDTIDEGIHAVDVQGVTIVYNTAAGRLDGLTPKDVLGKHVLSAFPSLAHDTSTLLQVIQTGQTIQNQPQTYTNFFGMKVHTVNTTLPIISEGQIVGALEIAKDLTQVKRLSEQVLELQAKVAGGRKAKPAQSGSRALYRFAQIITSDQELQGVKDRAAMAARTLSPILIYGETGTGKELLVQSIHNASQRYEGPFMALNCAALPATLLEGILFGTIRGSFTGAEDRAGLFELADGGMLFLDEIQSMPLELQAKLLRVLQEGEIRRVGDSRIRRIDVRVVAAMNDQPEEAVAAGKLRADLYYRINVVRFDLPPLRDRIGDLALLARHFIDKLNGRFGAHVTGLTPGTIDTLKYYPWPGNVRELENAIEAAMNVVTDGEISIEAMPKHIRQWAITRKAQESFQSSRAENSAYPQMLHVDDDGFPWREALTASGMDDFWRRLQEPSAEVAPWRHMQTVFERIVLHNALLGSGGNVQAAARKLGLPRQTLQYRIKQLGL